MEQVHVIRHKHFVEGMSARRIARQLRLNRRTVRKYLGQSEPRREEVGDRAQPVLRLVRPRIDALVEEGTPRLEGKHRLTAPRLYAQPSDPAPRLGQFVPSHGGGAVLSRQQSLAHRGPLGPQAPRPFVDAHPIDAWRSLVSSHAPIGRAQVLRG